MIVYRVSPGSSGKVLEIDQVPLKVLEIAHENFCTHPVSSGLSESVIPGIFDA